MARNHLSPTMLEDGHDNTVDGKELLNQLRFTSQVVV